MDENLIGGLIEAGSMGMFAGFLVWQYTKMQARFDKLVEKFQSQIGSVQDKNEQNETKIRDRYDAVIKGLQDDKTTFRVNVAEQVSQVNREIDLLKEKIESMPFDALRLQIESISLNQRNNQLILEKGMAALEQIQEEQKIKAMARKVAKVE